MYNSSRINPVPRVRALSHSVINAVRSYTRGDSSSPLASFERHWPLPQIGSGQSDAPALDPSQLVVLTYQGSPQGTPLPGRTSDTCLILLEFYVGQDRQGRELCGTSGVWREDFTAAACIYLGQQCAVVDNAYGHRSTCSSCSSRTTGMCLRPSRAI